MDPNKELNYILAAYPLNSPNELPAEYWGLTKLEQTCITHGIAKTGDKVLDEIITSATRKKIAVAAMQGLMANPAYVTSIQMPTGPDATGQNKSELAAEIIAKNAVLMADKLMYWLNDMQDERGTARS